LSVLDAFGLPQYSYQPCNFPNEVIVHVHEDDESDSVELVEIENTSKKHKIIFKYNWKTIFPWTSLIKYYNGNEGIKCSWCVTFKRDTHFQNREAPLFSLVV